MKKIMQLMLLAAFVALPAWAGDAAPVSATPNATPEATAKKAPAKKVKKAKKAAAKQAAPAELAPLVCPTGCAMMNCPPPNGPVKCCNTTTHQTC